jgi:hypothetical protein
MSDTRNVKLGVCQVYFDGIDLGYTKGGVEVAVSTETYKSTVDQFGQTPINELVMGREVKVTCPLAETTIENMVLIMPGASLIQTGGTKASGTITVATNPINNETIIVNGATVTFKTAVTGADEVLIGIDAATTAANLRSALQASTNPAIAVAQYTGTTAATTVTFNDFGLAGNAFTLVTGTAAAKVTMSGATLTGGVEPTAKKVSVTDGVGTDLLSIAKELRLHPKGKALSDKSEDFVIPLAATAGALTFAYKFDEERVFNVEFMGYPDAAQGGKIFHFGN